MFDPYHKWLGIPKDQRPPTHYQLLGIAPDETDAEVIEEAAVRQTAHVRTYQIGLHAAQCTRLLNEIAQAKLTLLDPAKRQAYLAQLAARQETRVTAKAAEPTAASAFQFDHEPVSTPPRRRPSIGQPAPQRAAPQRLASSTTALLIGLGIGGGAAVLLTLAVVFLRQSAEPPGDAVAKVEKQESRQALPIADVDAPLAAPAPAPAMQPPQQPLAPQPTQQPEQRSTPPPSAQQPAVPKTSAPQTPAPQAQSPAAPTAPPGNVTTKPPVGQVLDVGTTGGATIVGVIDANDPRVGITIPMLNADLRLYAKSFVVKLLAGRRYQFDMTSEALDSVLAVQDEDGKTLAFDDDGGDGLNSRLVYEAAVDANFRIVAASLNDNSTGQFMLYIRNVGPVAKTTLAKTSVAKTELAKAIDKKADKAADSKTKPYKVPAAGVSITERLTLEDPTDTVMRSSPHKLFRFALAKNRTYVIELYGNGFDAYLRLEDPDGKQLLSDDDSAGSLNSRIIFRPTTNGYYRVIATSLGGGRGDFILRVR